MRDIPGGAVPTSLATELKKMNARGGSGRPRFMRAPRAKRTHAGSASAARLQIEFD